MQALLPSFAIAAPPINSIAPQVIAQQTMAAAANSFEFLIIFPFDTRTASSHASFERIDDRQFRAFLVTGGRQFARGYGIVVSGHDDGVSSVCMALCLRA